MRRLTILLATVAALMLVPAAQALAEGTAKVNIEGSGAGEVRLWIYGELFFGTTPPIKCEYTPPGPATGACEGEMNEPGEEEGATGYTAVEALAAPGSEFVGWVMEENGPSATGGCELNGGKGSKPGTVGGNPGWLCPLEGVGGGNASVTAFFECETEGGCEEGGGPTNKRALSVTKSGTGAGSVKSKPKGISCGNTCSSAEASLYKETSVVLTAKAAATAGSNLEGWEGCDSSTNTGIEGTCTVKMTEARNVVAKFGGTQKAIVNPKALTLAKVDNGFETGFGTVKATGLACEADCIATTALYTGGVTEPKVKPAAVATLTAVAAAGSTFTGWSGCDTETEGKCVVTMSSAKSVEAEFTALPRNALTLTKVGYGAIKSKPKGVSCGNTCSSATASLASDTTIVLSAKAGTGSSLSGWEGCDSSTNTGLEGTCTVAMSEAKAVKVTFTAAIKPLINPQPLTLTKAGSGYGTVKATGITCEAACTTTTTNYYGGVTEPKPKPAAVVTLVGTPAPGSQAVSWSGCDSETEGKCVVSMSAAKGVTATFDELE